METETETDTIITKNIPYFAENTMIRTNRGDKMIKDITIADVLGEFRVQKVLKIKTKPNTKMVKISKHALFWDGPNEDLYANAKNKFYVNNVLTNVQTLRKTYPGLVTNVSPPICEYGYNLILIYSDANAVLANNILCETLSHNLIKKYLK